MTKVVFESEDVIFHEVEHQLTMAKEKLRTSFFVFCLNQTKGLIKFMADDD